MDQVIFLPIVIASISVWFLLPVLIAADFVCVLILLYGLFLKWFEPRQYQLFTLFQNGGVRRLLVIPVSVTLLLVFLEMRKSCCRGDFVSFLFNVQMVIWGAGVGVIVFMLALRQLGRLLKI